MDRSVSCTIMAYNEEETLAEATSDVVTALRELPFRPIEVLIVDDGSTDQTPTIAEHMAELYPEVRVIRHEKNRGPGSALITGFQQSKHDLICFHAADQQLPFADVAALLPLLLDHDLVIGKRTDRPGYSKMRLLSSHVYITLVHTLYGLREYEDFNFLYLYRRELLAKIQIETTGVFMPTEIMVKAVGLGAKVAQATVQCLPRRAGVATCGRPQVIIHTFREMMRFWVLQQMRKFF